MITLYHNTSNENAIKINKEGIRCGMRLSAYGKGSEAEGSGIWCSTVRGYGYGGATISFQVDDKDEMLVKQNDTEYIVYRDIKPEEIIDIDLVVSKIVINRLPSMTESAIPLAIEKYGKEKCYMVFEKYAHNFVEPYNMEQLKHLVETGEKYCKGSIKVESKLIESSIPKKYQDMVEGDIYKGGDGYWCIDLKDGYTTQGGYSYIWEKTKREALSQLKEVTKDSELFESLSNNTIKNTTKETLINRVNQLVKQYGKLKAGWQLAYEFNDGFYQEDKRKSKIQYVKDCINNCYENNKDTSDNRDIIKYIDNAERRLSSESNKLEEVSRNELLVKAKAETITRYNKSAGYKGFSLVDIDTTAIKTRDCLIVTNQVGKYFDTIELEDILYWVGLEVDETRDKKMGLEPVRRALLGAMDGMDLKVDCSCPDFRI